MHGGLGGEQTFSMSTVCIRLRASNIQCRGARLEIDSECIFDAWNELEDIASDKREHSVDPFLACRGSIAPCASRDKNQKSSGGLTFMH